MLIFFEQTPNPDALKFVPEAPLAQGAGRWFARDQAALADAPLARRLFRLHGVVRVFITAAFVTVTRDPAGPPWAELKHQVIGALADHLESGEPAMAPAAPDPEAEDGIEAEIRQVLGRYVRPGVSRDGGDVAFERFDAEAGVLWVRLQGACGGCPSARMTLKAGIEQIVRRYVPEVQRVEEARQEVPTARRESWWKLKAAEPGAERPRTIFTRSAGRRRSG